MKDKFMEIAKDTYAILTDCEFSSKIRGIEKPEEVPDIIQNSMDLINASENVDVIKRICVRSEIKDNPQYTNVIVDMIMSDKELSDTITAGFIARELETDSGEVVFNHRFYLTDRSESVATINTGKTTKPYEKRREIKDKIGYFNYDLPVE